MKFSYLDQNYLQDKSKPKKELCKIQYLVALIQTLSMKLEEDCRTLSKYSGVHEIEGPCPQPNQAIYNIIVQNCVHLFIW